MSNMVKVGMADLKVVSHPDSLTTLGLGSCVGICLYDSTTKVTGMAHIM
ncbi:MAG TPA: chemotaxis protein CheD, partial [Clostridiales bacterium UBA8960]|nr:chemotaxis protein CheD [Clostridiales bacterium UBA8960]